MTRFVLSEDVMAKCREHALHAVAGYAENKYPESAALTVNDADKKPIVWAESKMAECIFALDRGLDPMTAVRFCQGPELDGVDVTAGDVRVDVKQTRPGGKMMIWSVGKEGKLETKKIDALVLATCRWRDGAGQCVGWISKGEFLRRRRFAPPPGPPIIPGTPYVDVLRSMDSFPLTRRHMVDDKPDKVAQSTWDAFTWLRRHAPERLDDWLARHEEISR